MNQSGNAALNRALFGPNLERLLEWFGEPAKKTQPLYDFFSQRLDLHVRLSSIVSVHVTRMPWQIGCAQTRRNS